MTKRSNFVALRLLIGDTFRQANASGICVMMLAVTGVCSLLCLSVNVSGDVSLHDGDERVFFLPSASPGLASSTAALSREARASLDTDPEVARREGVETVSGRVNLAFGAVTFPMSRERVDAVRFLETLLAGGIAGTFGLLLALVWTAGFMPTFLEPGAASVLIAKPVARWQLLIGKYGSVLTFVGLQVALFVALTWLSLGVRTGVWDTTYLWCIPLLLLQFAVFYSFSVLLAVVTRSTVACVFGSVLFWLLSWGINYGSVMARALPEPQSLPAPTLALTDAAYWVSPKPIDAALILFNSLDAQHHFEKPLVFKLLESEPSFSPGMSILSSLILTGLLMALSTYEFKATEY
jgi:ABC-type transport system involved in multi-copper enzyme maturation permease subunit